MPTLTLGAADFSNVISKPVGTGVVSSYGYGYGMDKGQIGITFVGAAAQTVSFTSGVASTVVLGTVTQNEIGNGGASSLSNGMVKQAYGPSATDENGKLTYSKASNQVIYTGPPNNPATANLEGWYSQYEGTNYNGMVMPDNTIAGGNSDLDVPLSLAITDGSSATLNFLAALPRTAGAPAAVNPTGTVTLVHGYVADPDVDYKLDLGSRTATFANGDKLTVTFAPVSLSDNPQTAQLAATFTLVQPASYAIAAASATKPEGNAGSTPFTFTVTRSGDSSAAATLGYAVTGTGTNPANAADFTGGVLPTGSVAFAAGDTTKTITVNVAGDTTNEPDETFAVTLTGPGGTNIASPSATGTILNDDPGTGPVKGTPIVSGGSPQDPLFDRAFYLAHNPDVAAAGIDPYQHYLTSGWREGRDPSALFSTSFYLVHNPDVAAAGINPLLHFEQSGWREGRDPSPGFSDSAYLKANPDVAAAGIDPLLHYVQSGQAEGRARFLSTSTTDPLVNVAYIDTVRPDVAAAGVDATAWFHSSGWHEGTNPDALFDVTYYLGHNPDVAAAHVDPLLHYEASGWHEGRNPSAAFSTNAYLAHNPDVAAAGLDPLVHYLQSGQAEGRAIYPA